MDLITLTGLFSTGIGIFLSTFYLLRNKWKDDRYTFLYLTLAILAYEVFYKTLIHSRLIYDFTALYSGRRFFNLLIYPLFLFFIWTVTRINFRLKPGHWLVLLLLIAYTLFTFGQGWRIPMADKQQMLDLFYEDKRPGPYNYWSNWWIFFKSTGLPLFFLSIIGYDFFQFKRRVSNIQNKRLLNFLSLVIVLYFLFYQSSNLIYRWAYQSTGFSMIEWPVDICFLALILLLLSIVTVSVNSGDTFFPPAKYAASALDKKIYDKMLADARRLMEGEELFKNEQLSIADVAGRLGTNPKYLSQALNDHLALSFVDFINQYRVEEAKKQLWDDNNRALTIEAIGQLAGFRSKSSFFRAFKKFTGFTPNQFLRSKGNQ